MDIWLLIALLLITFIAGMLGAMLGLGGGFIIIPVLTLMLNIPIHIAIGASIIGVIATSSAAATVYVQEQLVNVKLAMILETATTVGGIAGAFIAVYLNQRVLSLIFALFMIYSAYRLFSQQERKYVGGVKGGLSGRYYDKALGCDVEYCVTSIHRGLAASFLAGNFSGMLGVGGGLVKVPAMYLWMNVPMKVATATSNFMIGVTAAASAYIYYTHGFIDTIITAIAAIGVFLGATLGSRFASSVESKALRRVFAAVLLFIAVMMFGGVLW